MPTGSTTSQGNLLTAGQLNEFETWQLYIDQELDDSKASIDGTVPGEAVKSVTGTAPITVDNTDNQTPVIGIDQTYVTGNPNNLVSDTKVMPGRRLTPPSRRSLEQSRLSSTGVAFG